MFHPFQPELEDMTIPQVEEKIFELSKKYHQASNPQVKDQIATFIEIYKTELSVKIAKQKLNDDNDNKDLDNLINIS
jgi:ribosome-associated translation inhibitor RaiA